MPVLKNSKFSKTDNVDSEGGGFEPLTFIFMRPYHPPATHAWKIYKEKGGLSYC